MLFSSFVTPFSGMMRVVTASSPSASIASLSVSAESMPPDSPRTALRYPAFAKYFFSSLVR